MPKPRTSKLHLVSDAELIEAVKIVQSLSQLMATFELSGGSTFAALRTRVKQLGLYEKFQSSQFWNRGKTHLTDTRISSSINEENLLTKNSYINTGYAKLLFIQTTNAELRCSHCKLDTWLGHTLTLELDHINGDNRDNQIENLRLLCPNCHSLTSTWRGRNVKNHGKRKVTDEELLAAIKSEKSIAKALQKVCLSGGGNYNRCYKLLCKSLQETSQITHL